MADLSTQDRGKPVEIEDIPGIWFKDQKPGFAWPANYDSTLWFSIIVKPGDGCDCKAKVLFLTQKFCITNGVMQAPTLEPGIPSEEEESWQGSSGNYDYQTSE